MVRTLRWPLALAVAALFQAAPPAFAGSDHETCLACHGEKDSGGPFVDAPRFKKSVHGDQDCAACHEGFTGYPHPQNPPKVQCATCHEDNAESFRGSHHGQFWKVGEPEACLKCHGNQHSILPPDNPESPVSRAKLPTTCGKCHPQVVKDYLASVHGQAFQKGVKEVPVCTSCHGEHKILGPHDAGSPVSAGRIPETCAQCHGSVALSTEFKIDPEVAETYKGGFHGVALQAGVTQAANCASCHGVHNIQPPSDPRSSVNPANLARTCSKCHPGAGAGVTEGKIHQNPRDVSNDKPVGFIRLMYIWFIALVLGGMLLHNGLDFLYKVTHPGVKLLPESFYAEERLSKWERVQHGLLVSSFLTLVYTGFAHTYPGAWWAKPFALLASGASVRHWIHVVAGFVLLASGLTHASWLAFTRRGRRRFSEMFPAFHDVKDFLHRQAFVLSRRKDKPPHRPFTYIEKAEYWALVWGTGVMGVTGMVVVVRDWSLAHLPKWVIDVLLTIHFWEAVLATGAIVIWHFYWVMYDPDVYPMNWSWKTGRPRRSKREPKRTNLPEGK